ncbi:MAG: PKD domain-containing protein, partial [Chloroflexi bacterium]|nr:PKD domain-containing protein [Chloroflexota bacterium]
GFSNTPRQELFNYGGGGGGVADLNQDGYPDLVLGGYNDGDYFAYSYIYWGSASGYSQTNRTGLNAYGTLAVDIGDLNKDGYLDLVLASYYDGNSATNSYIYWGSETGYSWLDRNTVPTYRARDVKIADLNNDTHPDLVFANYQTDGSYLVDSYVYWGDGSKTGFSSSNRTGLPTQGARGVAVADFNQDGQLDLAFANYRDAQHFDMNSYIYWGANTAEVYSATQRLELPTSKAKSALAADLNGDGWLDLAFGQEYNDGTGSSEVQNPIYWNSPVGFNTTNVSSLPGWRSAGLGVALPHSEQNSFAFGRVIAQHPLNFTADAQFGPTPLEVTFINQADESWSNFLWDFGDGTTSTAISPTHVFTPSGIYTVTLQAQQSGSTQSYTSLNRVIATQGTNLALNQPATASSVWYNQVADNAVDHNLHTHWFSNGSSGSWLYVDLGRAYNVNELLLSWFWDTNQGEPATALIETSLDGNNWETVYTDTVSSALNNSIRFIPLTPPAHGRYLRVYGQTLYGSKVGVSELQAFGDIAIDAEQSVLVANPGLVTADSVTTSTITATLISSDDQPIVNWPVSLSVSGQNNFINGQSAPSSTWVDIGFSNAQGLITATLTSSRAEDKVVQAKTKTFLFTQPVTVTFLPGLPDGNNSLLTVIGNDTAAADGVDTIDIQVTALDAYNNPISDTTVVLSSTATVSFTQPTLTDQNGETIGQVSSDEVGPAEIGAVIGGIVITDTATIAFGGVDLVLSENGPAEASLDGVVNYTLTIQNDGLLTAPNVVVTHTLPSTITFVEASISPTTQLAQTQIWNFAELASQDALNLVITGTVSPIASIGTSLVAMGTTTSDLDETNFVNNSDSFTSTVGSGAATELLVTAPPDVDLLAPFDLTVTLRDVAGNIATGYEDSVSLTTSDGSAAFPISHQFNNITDQGIYTFTNLYLKNSGTQTITISDGTLSETVSLGVDKVLVVVDQDTTWDETDVVLGTLVVTGTNTTLTLVGSIVITADEIIIDSGATISANGLGYSLSQGPGADNSGASHGGYGGGNQPTYGSVYTPTALGSSGNNGRGGGAMHLIV